MWKVRYGCCNLFASRDHCASLAAAAPLLYKISNFKQGTCLHHNKEIYPLIINNLYLCTGEALFSDLPFIYKLQHSILISNMAITICSLLFLLFVFSFLFYFWHNFDNCIVTLVQISLYCNFLIRHTLT